MTATRIMVNNQKVFLLTLIRGQLFSVGRYFDWLWYWQAKRGEGVVYWRSPPFIKKNEKKE